MDWFWQQQKLWRCITCKRRQNSKNFQVRLVFWDRKLWTSCVVDLYELTSSLIKCHRNGTLFRMKPNFTRFILTLASRKRWKIFGSGTDVPLVFYKRQHLRWIMEPTFFCEPWQNRLHQSLEVGSCWSFFLWVPLAVGANHIEKMLF